jgi:hypothetical protein
MNPVSIADIHRIAGARKPGYLDAIMAHSIPHPTHRGIVLISDHDYRALAAQFALAPRPRRDRQPRVHGLGDKIHRVLGPIGRAIKWPCIKRDGTTNLIPGSPCDKARQALNKITS